MKKIIIASALLGSTIIFGQNTGIGTTAPNATLEIKADGWNRNAPDGIMIPSVTKDQLVAKTAYGMAQTGAMVYVNTMSNNNTFVPTKNIDMVGYYYWDGAQWQRVGYNEWSVTGNAGTNPAVNFLGTTDDKDLLFRRNNRTVGRFANDAISFGSSSGGVYSSVAMGDFALGSISTGGANTALGFYSMWHTTTGSQNTVIGVQAGSYLLGGNNNVIMGAYTGYALNAGSDNVAIGGGALNSAPYANSNVAIGNGALYAAANSELNVAVGANSGSWAQGNKNIFIGNNTQGKNYIGSGVATPYTANNEMNIGNAIYGFNINDGNESNDRIGVATSDPTEMLDVNGNIKVRGTNTAITEGGSCTNPGTISYGTDNNFYGCAGTVWKKLNN